MTINRHWIYEGVVTAPSVGGEAGLYRVVHRMYSLMFHVVHLTCLENWPDSRVIWPESDGSFWDMV